MRREPPAHNCTMRCGGSIECADRALAERPDLRSRWSSRPCRQPVTGLPSYSYGRNEKMMQGENAEGELQTVCRADRGKFAT
jgi:hypothetical protein